MKKFFASLLAAALTVTVCVSPAAAKETAYFTAFPQPVPASALERTSPNGTAFTAAADALESAVSAGTAADEQIVPLLTAMVSAHDALQTADIAYELAYYRDPSSAGGDYTAWSDLMAEAENRYTEILQTALASKYAETAYKTIGAEAAGAALGSSVDTQAQLDLLSQCSSLENDYWTGINAAYAAEFDGKSYSYEELVEACNSGKLTYDQYRAGSLQIAKKKNAAVAPIYTSLVKLYNQYAVSKGYRNYAEYAYPHKYGRDYTTQDAESFETYVKKYIVPVYRECNTIANLNDELGDDKLTSLENLSQQQVIELVQPHMNDVSSEYAKLFDYMVQNKLCDLERSSKKLSVGFTITLPQYGSAYIFTCPDGYWNDVRTLIHEFGHFSQACLDENGFTSYDVAETDSQGLEAMYLRYADSIAGETGGDAFRSKTVLELLDGIVQGCIYDEFQQRAYENGNMTVDGLNRLYRSVGEEYGLQFASTDGEAYGWVDVDHTFTQPFYYLSYATSASAALELLTISEDDYDSADNKYLQLVADSDDYSFRALLKKEGLPSVFGEQNMQKLAANVLRYMESEAADVPDYTDISGHWFESGAKLISAQGVMRGSGTSFDPDGKVTRAMFVTALYRAYGGEKADTAAFSDVSDPGAWYYDAVNWAADAGYVQGWEGRFRPDEEISRQDMAVILMRMFGGDTQADESVLTAYADSAAIADYARSAVADAAQLGLMQGSGGSFDPNGATTRAQVGQVLLRCEDTAA